MSNAASSTAIMPRNFPTLAASVDSPALSRSIRTVSAAACIASSWTSGITLPEYSWSESSRMVDIPLTAVRPTASATAAVTAIATRNLTAIGRFASQPAGPDRRSEACAMRRMYGAKGR